MSTEHDEKMVLRGQVYALQVLIRAIAETAPISSHAALNAKNELDKAGGNTDPSFIAGVESVKDDAGHFVFQGGGHDRIAMLEAEVVAQRHHIKALISLIVATPESTAPFNEAVRASNREAASSNDDAFKAAMPEVLRNLQTRMKRA